MLLEVRMAESREVTQGWTRISWSGDPLVGRLKLMVTFGMIPSKSHCNTNRNRSYRDLRSIHLLAEAFLNLNPLPQLNSLFSQGIVLFAFCTLVNSSIMLPDSHKRDQESLLRAFCLHWKPLKSYFKPTDFSPFLSQTHWYRPLQFLLQPSECI